MLAPRGRTMEKKDEKKPAAEPPKDDKKPAAKEPPRGGFVDVNKGKKKKADLIDIEVKAKKEEAEFGPLVEKAVPEQLALAKVHLALPPRPLPHHGLLWPLLPLIPHALAYLRCS